MLKHTATSVTMCCLLGLAIGCGGAATEPSAPDAAAPVTNSSSQGEVASSEDFAREARNRTGVDIRRQQGPFNTEDYAHIVENRFRTAARNPLSTFSIDVDTASYANVRRFLNQSRLPPPGAVRTEEFVNYFTYDYVPPEGEHPFAVHAETAACPWQEGHHLLRIGLKGREIERGRRPASNLVFLLDVSGSMQRPDKLPLVKSAMKLLVDRLDERDRVAIVVYAGASGLVLPSTSAVDKTVILSALNQLEAGGSTNGGAGIRLAYRTATEHFIDGGTNRVILCTDGDFNVGTTSDSALVNLIQEKAESGVFLSVVGFGTGNYKDAKMESLADRGNGNYAYVDTLAEARRVFVERLTGTLVTIAKDVKIQVDFNPARVRAYRLLGYENRMLQAEDFRDDEKDAGEIGAGHTVTALYQLVPPGVEFAAPDVQPSKYQQPSEPVSNDSNDLLTVRLRYKEPDGETGKEFEHPVAADEQPFADAPEDFRFAAAVAEFSLLLRGSQYKGTAGFEQVRRIASGSRGDDPHGYRAEFLGMVRQAQALSDRAAVGAAGNTPAVRRR